MQEHGTWFYVVFATHFLKPLRSKNNILLKHEIFTYSIFGPDHTDAIVPSKVPFADTTLVSQGSFCTALSIIFFGWHVLATFPVNSVMGLGRSMLLAFWSRSSSFLYRRNDLHSLDVHFDGLVPLFTWIDSTFSVNTTIFSFVLWSFSCCSPCFFSSLSLIAAMRAGSLHEWQPWRINKLDVIFLASLKIIWLCCPSAKNSCCCLDPSFCAAWVINLSMTLATDPVVILILSVHSSMPTGWGSCSERCCLAGQTSLDLQVFSLLEDTNLSSQ